MPVASLRGGGVPRPSGGGAPRPGASRARCRGGPVAPARATPPETDASECVVFAYGANMDRRVRARRGVRPRLLSPAVLVDDDPERRWTLSFRHDGAYATVTREETIFPEGDERGRLNLQPVHG